MLKILHIIPSLRKGGAERLVLDICNELHQRPGVEVCLVTFRDENEYSFLCNDINLQVIPSRAVPSITGKPSVQIDDLMAFIGRFKPHVIHSHLFEAEMVSRWHIVHGVKYFTHCHDNMHQLRKFSLADCLSKKRLVELFERRLITRKYTSCNNHFIAISRHTFKYFQLVLLPKLADNLHLLHNAINVKAFATVQHQSKTLVLINIGSFVPKKNQILLVHIVRELLSRGLSCRAIMLGDGCMKESVIQEIHRLNLDEHIDMPGNVSDVGAWMSKASLYVHTAFYEPLGLVLLEAMAAGLPVITLDGGGNSDLIVEGKNGFLLGTNDPGAFADKIIALFDDKLAYDDISRFARKHARKFDIGEYVDKLLMLYNKA